MKLEIEHIIRIPKTVEVPDTCPHCEGQFAEVGLYHWEFQDQRRSVDVVLGVDGKLVTEFESALPHNGPTAVPQAWQCGNCVMEILEAELVSIEGPLAEKVLELSMLIQLAHTKATT